MLIRTTAIALGILIGTSTLYAAEATEYTRSWRVQLVDDSVWAHCEVAISRWKNGEVKQVSECRVDDYQQTATRILAAAEVEFLTKLLRESSLFEGQSWGKDLRGLDSSLWSITVDDGTRVTTVVASFNPTFDDGPRKVLLNSLMTRARESMKATSGPTRR
jgi:hypothetical protein